MKKLVSIVHVYDDGTTETIPQNTYTPLSLTRCDVCSKLPFGGDCLRFDCPSQVYVNGNVLLSPPPPPPEPPPCRIVRDDEPTVIFKGLGKGVIGCVNAVFKPFKIF